MRIKQLVPERIRAWIFWRRANTFALVKKIGHRFGLSKWIWHRALPSEVEFWDKYLSTRGKSCNAEEEFIFRTAPDSELQSWLKKWMPLPENSTLKIIDVGAGPLTWVGKKWGNRKIFIEAIDPLAEMYDQLMQNYGIVPPVRTKKGDGETVVQQFGLEVFDVAFARNCLDHSYDAIQAIRGMIEIIRLGGIICLWHNQDEAERLSYLGLHQWNFRLQNGELLVWNGHRILNVNKEFAEILQPLRCDLEGDMIWAIYRKK